jgi:peptidoglycan/xylan/chitin deacetylase (PgdA/CDA1 family)
MLKRGSFGVVVVIVVAVGWFVWQKWMVFPEGSSPVVWSIQQLSKWGEIDSWYVVDSHRNGTDKQLSPDGKVHLAFFGDRSKKLVALTFDADMTPGMKRELNSGHVHSYFDPRVVQILRKNQAKATFFVTGMFAETYPDAIREIARSPLFELGNHSYSHPSFHGWCYGLPQVTDKESEIERTQDILERVTGKTSSLFRFPGGCYSQDDITLVTQLGLIVVDWDVVSGDAFNDNASSIESSVLHQVQNGSIVVMHVNGSPTAPKTSEALPTIIATLRKEGYEFVTVSELLGEDSWNIGQLFHFIDG